MYREAQLQEATEEQIAKILNWKLESLTSLSFSLCQQLHESDSSRVSLTEELNSLRSKAKQQEDELELAETEEEALLCEMAEVDRELAHAQDIIEQQRRVRIGLLATKQAGFPNKVPTMLTQPIASCGNGSEHSSKGGPAIVPEQPLTGGATKSGFGTKSHSGIERNHAPLDARNRVAVFGRCVAVRDSDADAHTEAFLECIDQHNLAIKASAKSEEKLQYFDHLFNQRDNQAGVFNLMQSWILQGIEDVQICIMSHGGILSGKSYSLFGQDSEDAEGLVSRSLRLISEKVKQTRDLPGSKQNFTYSFTEVYNDKLFNLFDEKT
jgi:Kinesin motor domain